MEQSLLAGFITSTWELSLDHALQQQVMEVLLVLAERLADPAVVQTHVTSQPKNHWSAATLFSGLPGLALFFLFLARITREQCWFDCALRYALLAREACERQSSISLRDLSQWCVFLFCFEQVDASSQRARLTLQTRVAQQLVDTRQQFPTPLAYDVMGVSGLLGALLLPHSDEDDLIPRACEVAASRLVAFVAPHDPQREAGWAVPASYFPAQVARYQETPIINCGLAHGIAGPLAALSLARLAGWSMPHQEDAIRCLSSWLFQHRLEMPWGIDWPAVIPLDLPLEEVQRLPPARTAWCYGTPGIARACWLAGHALEEQELQAQALLAMEGVMRRPEETRQIASLSLCHGKAGFLLQATLFYQETHLPSLREEIALLTRQMLSGFEPTAPFGFRFPLSGAHIDALGLMLGATGTALALLAACSPCEPQWARALLLI
ncbi:lanthionine synthetase C family protein [Ktedonospora formicarum]|uniref:Uncharacterized protein n=1 Tax=Ktedonospora formicarum TaxID=2778364 RepID=A0A8J3I9R2_9CHLR|nr:lanthionine synthetase C family protein [Ktedonospora formicarum]GHO48592.1 hypothetical protein KSX_67550 [Ktedonospora formicarum]